VTKVRVTEKEFLIAFSYSDRDRAKLIRNYRWDPIEKVWHYPLSQRTYKELLREFDSDELEFTGDLSRLIEWNRSVQSDEELNSIPPSFTAGDDDDLPGSEEYRLMCSLHETVSRHGFSVKSNEELLRFLQECVLQRSSDALADTRLTIQNAKLKTTLAELGRPRLEDKTDSGNFEATLVTAAWGCDDIPRPDFLMSYKFDSDGVIKATELVARTLSAILHKSPDGAGSLYELIREAVDAQIISKDVHRLCETLRHQRNRFGHDRIGTSGTLQHALLSLVAFSLVYRELYPQLPRS
jgi:hypothetical protein